VPQRGEPIGGGALQRRTMTRNRCGPLAAVLLTGLAAAQPADPLRSAACRQALDALSTEEARTAPVRTTLEAARRRAASACLARRDDAPAPASRLAQPPQSVPPVAVTPRAPARPAAPPAAVPAPRAPVAITACDAVGCWSSDGTRLQRVGPDLLGPRGFCTTTAGVLNCP
jgi:hypothetical protein